MRDRVACACRQLVPIFCMTFVDIGRGDGPIEYVTIGGYGTVFSTYAVGSDLSVQSSQMDGESETKNGQREEPRYQDRGQGTRRHSV